MASIVVSLLASDSIDSNTSLIVASIVVSLLASGSIDSSITIATWIGTSPWKRRATTGTGFTYLTTFDDEGENG